MSLAGGKDVNSSHSLLGGGHQDECSKSELKCSDVAYRNGLWQQLHTLFVTSNFYNDVMFSWICEHCFARSYKTWGHVSCKDSLHSPPLFYLFEFSHVKEAEYKLQAWTAPCVCFKTHWAISMYNALQYLNKLAFPCLASLLLMSVTYPWT